MIYFVSSSFSFLVLWFPYSLVSLSGSLLEIGGHIQKFLGDFELLHTSFLDQVRIFRNFWWEWFWRDWNTTCLKKNLATQGSTIVSPKGRHFWNFNASNPCKMHLFDPTGSFFKKRRTIVLDQYWTIVLLFYLKFCTEDLLWAVQTFPVWK